MSASEQVLTLTLVAVVATVVSAAALVIYAWWYAITRKSPKWMAALVTLTLLAVIAGAVAALANSTASLM